MLGHGVLLWEMDKFCGTTFHDITATCQLQVASLFLLFAFLEAWWDFNGETFEDSRKFEHLVTITKEEKGQKGKLIYKYICNMSGPI